jgi:hypothetical protein
MVTLKNDTAYNFNDSIFHYYYIIRDIGENSRVQTGQFRGPTTQKGPPCCDCRQPAKHMCVRGAAYFTEAHTGPHF